MTTNRTIRAFTRRAHFASTAALALALLAGAHLARAAGVAETAETAVSDAKSAVHQTKNLATDSWITAKVKAEILANSVSKAFKVGVQTTHGVVSLSGKLPNEDAIDLVKLIAKNVKGVKEVDGSALEVGN